MFTPISINELVKRAIKKRIQRTYNGIGWFDHAPGSWDMRYAEAQACVLWDRINGRRSKVRDYM